MDINRYGYFLGMHWDGLTVRPRPRDIATMPNCGLNYDMTAAGINQSAVWGHCKSSRRHIIAKMRREDDSVSRSRFGFHAECKGHTWTTGPSASQRDPLTKSTAWNNGGDIHIPCHVIYIYTYTDRKEPRKLKLIECLWPFHTALHSFLCLRSAFHCIRLAISDKAASQEPLPFDSSRNGEHPMRQPPSGQRRQLRVSGALCWARAEQELGKFCLVIDQGNLNGLKITLKGKYK